MPSLAGPVWYPWGSILELEVPPNQTPGLITLHPHNTNVFQSITYAKSPYPPGRSNPGQKENAIFVPHPTMRKRTLRVRGSD